MKDMLERLRQASALISIVESANSVLEIKSGLIVATLEGEILYMSPGACEIFEHPTRRTPGETLDVLMPERYRAMHRAGIARIAAGGASHMEGKNLSLVGLTRSGKEIALLLKVGIEDGGDLGKVLVGRVYTHPDVDRSLLLAVESGARGET